MANVRCPMCSRFNEADAPVCAFCGARLKPLRPSSGSAPEPKTSGSEPEEDEPEWLRGLRAEEQPPEETPSQASPESGTADVPDWLSRIRDKAREETGPEQDQAGLGDEGQAEWMQDFQADSGAGAAFPDQAGPLDSDWLDRLQQDQAPAEETGGLPEAASSADEDWMSKLDTWQPEPAKDNPQPEVDSDLSWLSDLESGFAAPPKPAAFELPGEQPEPGLPDWLSDLEKSDQTPEGETVGAEPSAGPAELPDWLSGLETEAPGQPDFSPGEEARAPAGLPDWLGDEYAEAGAQSFPAGEAEEARPEAAGLPGRPGESEEPAAEAWPGSEEQAPAAEEQGPPVPAEALQEPSGPAPLLDDDTPDWLRDFKAYGAEDEETLPELVEGQGGQVELAGLAAAELPEWLAEEEGGKPPQEPERAVEEPAEEELVQAELPDWVREMRPIESVDLGAPAAMEADQRVEKAGPLAGLRGILPAEDTVTRYHKPPVYSARLRISEKQRSQASLLDSILEQESQPLLIPPRRSRAPHLIGRALVALLLLAALTIPFMFPLGLEPVPMLTPPELRDMFQQIDQNTQTESPVLLAVDYEPALAGEMHLAALPVVEHLMANNIPIAVVSTIPSGPVLAQSLLEEAAQNLAGREQPGEYDLAARTANLGYLPGGTISLLEFAQFPRQAAPASVAGDYEVWDQGVLRSITNLRDFAQVIVITDSAETGRAWVEQVQPLMGDVPLLMVASAQAEPMLIPFIDSGQIDGLTGGLLGGVLYSQWRQVEPHAGVYWPSYQVGIGLGFLLVLAGSLVSGAAALIKRGDKDIT